MPRIDALIGALSSDDEERRRVSREALTKIGQEAVGPLSIVTRDGNANARLSAVMTLAEIRDSGALDALVHALKDECAPIRVWAAEGLSRLRDARAVTPLAAVLEDDEVLPMAAEALGEIGDQRAISPLLEALAKRNEPRSPRDYLILVRVALALLKLGFSDEPVLGALRRVALQHFPGHHTWPSFRARAISALCDRGALDESLLAALLEDKAPDVSLQAARALLHVPSRRESAMSTLDRIAAMKHLRDLSRAATELLTTKE
jgi:HEAT repeat protein